MTKCTWAPGHRTALEPEGPGRVGRALPNHFSVRQCDYTSTQNLDLLVQYIVNIMIAISLWGNFISQKNRTTIEQYKFPSVGTEVRDGTEYIRPNLINYFEHLTQLVFEISQSILEIFVETLKGWYYNTLIAKIFLCQSCWLSSLLRSDPKISDPDLSFGHNVRLRNDCLADVGKILEYIIFEKRRSYIVLLILIANII